MYIGFSEVSVQKILDKAKAEKFYGQIEFTFKAGEIALARISQTKVLNQSERTDRHDFANR